MNVHYKWVHLLDHDPDSNPDCDPDLDPNNFCFLSERITADMKY